MRALQGKITRLLRDIMEYLEVIRALQVRTRKTDTGGRGDGLRLTSPFLASPRLSSPSLL